jgi:hypothetical protein
VNRRWGFVAGLVVLSIVSCSGPNGEPDRDAAPESSVPAPASDEAWRTVRGAPCDLLAQGDIDDLAEGGGAARSEEAHPSTCRYALGEDRSIEVTVFRPMSARARADRLRGTRPGSAEGTHELRLDVQGSALYVGEGATLALVAYRTPSGDEPLDPARLAEIASLVESRLPGGAQPSKADPDPCDLLPAESFGDANQGGDPGDADTCSLRGLDGTNVVVRVDRSGAMPEAGGLAEAWEEVGGGATWQGTADPDADTGSGVGFVPLDPGVGSVTVSSPERPLDGLRAQAAAVARLLARPR